MGCPALRPETDGLKRCRKCNRELPAAAFYRRKDTTDGLFGDCKRCMTSAQRLRRAKKRFRLNCESQAQADAADAIQAVSGVVAKCFGGRWDRFAGALAETVLGDDAAARLRALEATHRVYILAQSELERSRVTGSPEEYCRLLVDLDPEGLRESLTRETALALRDLISAAYGA